MQDYQVRYRTKIIHFGGKLRLPVLKRVIKNTKSDGELRWRIRNIKLGWELRLPILMENQNIKLDENQWYLS